MVALAAIIVLFLHDWVPGAKPSQHRCISLWNAPPNAEHREEVAKRGYPTAEIDETFSEDRYEGCYAFFLAGFGEPWAIYSAVRIPGTDTPLEWRLEMRGQEWGMDHPEPDPRPQPNAIVQHDGSLSLN